MAFMKPPCPLSTAAITATIPMSMMIPWMKSLMAVAIYPPRMTYTAVKSAMAITHQVYGMLNAISNSLDSPLYTEAVYGIRKMKTIMDAATLSALDPYRSPKKSGIVLDWRCWVMIFVLLPSTTQARRLPMTALPMPIQVLAMPYFHPN